MTKKELAIELHNKKYNCCQAVACSFANEFDTDAETLFKCCEAFGLGMGGMSGTCGALSGAVMLAGLKNSDGNLDTPATKASSYKISKEIHQNFEAKCGSTICRELKGVDTGKILCSCADCITNAVEIVEEVLF